MKTVSIYLAAFVSAVIVATVLASWFSTQFVIAGLESVGFDIPLTTRLSMTVKDLGILQTMLPVVGVAFLLAFLVSGLLASRLPGRRRNWFALGGASAIVVALLLIEYALGGMVVGGARTGFGLASQAVAGAAGGWLFVNLTSRWAGKVT